MPIIFKETEEEQSHNSSMEYSKAEKNMILQNLSKMHAAFIINKGQMDSKVKYYVKGRSFGFYFTWEEVILIFIKKDQRKILNDKQTEVSLALQFIDANPNVRIEGDLVDSGKVNYIRGNDPEKWCTDLTIYKKLIYKELWKGIDLAFYAGENQLKYEFIVHPGANLEDIRLSYKGNDSISLDEEGNLLIINKLGVLIDERPRSYQYIEGKEIVLDSRFLLQENKEGRSIFSFGIEDGFNLNFPIVIDPGLIYSSFLGGSDIDSSGDIAIDNVGNAYVTGAVQSTNFPVTLGAFQKTFNEGFFDAFVTKLNVDGSKLIYSTFLGGSDINVGSGIAVDNKGMAYVVGGTESANFPTTLGAFQTTFGGNSDTFISKLNADGSGLIYSTFLGGSNIDGGSAIAIDNKGNAYVTGQTSSTNFPITTGAFQTSLGGGSDVYVAKLNPDGTDLIYSTYLGGADFEAGLDIAVDNIGSAYVTGNTSSVDFPTTLGAFQTTFNEGDINVFITKINPSGSGLIYSTFLGGNRVDLGFSIAIDNIGNAYVTGATQSPNFPVTIGAFQTNLKAIFPALDVFVTKLNQDGSGLVYSTYIGGSMSSQGNAISVDDASNAYVVGSTFAPDFPTTIDAFQRTFGGIFDVFLTKLSNDGSNLIYSTFISGNSRDSGLGVDIDNEDNAYVTGATESANFPTTIGAFQTRFSGNSDAFILKINTNGNST